MMFTGNDMCGIRLSRPMSLSYISNLKGCYFNSYNDTCVTKYYYFIYLYVNLYYYQISKFKNLTNKS